MCQPIAASELERSTLQAGTLTAIDELDHSGRGTRGEQRGREARREVSNVFRVESASTAGTFNVSVVEGKRVTTHDSPIDILVNSDGLYDDPLLFRRSSLEGQLHQQPADLGIPVRPLDQPLDLFHPLALGISRLGIGGDLNVFDGHSRFLGGLEFHTDVSRGSGGRAELEDLEVRRFEGRVGVAERGDLGG